MTVLLTVRGTLMPSTLDSSRTLHNETAGSAPGIAAARALGDLSHNVFTPGEGPMQSAKPGDCLFLDRWVDAKGIMDFFSNKDVQGQAAKLWKSKDASVWMPGEGSFSYTLPVPNGKNERHVGIIRGQVKDPHAAIAIFAKVDQAAQKDVRRRGLVSHEIFIRMGAPNEPLELLGLDVWFDRAGMLEHYTTASKMQELSAAFSAQPDASIWVQAPGQWNEW